MQQMLLLVPVLQQSISPLTFIGDVPAGQSLLQQNCPLSIGGPQQNVTPLIVVATVFAGHPETHEKGPAMKAGSPRADVPEVSGCPLGA